jgi:hypothetical protein
MQPEAAAYEALLEAMTRLVRAPDAPAELGRDRAGYFLAVGVRPEDAAALAAYGDERLLVYRRHIRRTLAHAVRLEIPRTAARLGDSFVPWVERWIDEEAPRSRYFRDVAFELAAWAAPRWAADASVPPYLADLARHELTSFEVGSAQVGDATDESAEIALDRGVRFDDSVRLRRYEHAVHRLSEELDATDVPAREPTALLAYRDAEDEVRFLELTPLAAEILQRLIRGEALGGAVQGACATLGSPVDASVTASTAALLSDLADRGAITMGASPPNPGSGLIRGGKGD